MEPGLIQNILIALKEYPGILSLMCVIYWLCRSLQAKDAVIKGLLEVSQGDIERTTRLTTLLELLVSKREREVN